jgi:CYTH domain-containing protein
MYVVIIITNIEIIIMKVSKQYERKFLVKNLPDLSDWKKEEIQQWYTTEPNYDESIRIRKYDDGRCYVDIIQGFGKIREKFGKKSDWNNFKNKNMDNIPSIKKTRYKKSFANILMCIDIFDNGLKLVEIESYDNEFSIDNFDIPEWFSEEVTELMKYTNNWLAYNKE